MKSILRLIILLLFVAGWGLATLAMHVVHGADVATGEDRWVFLPKSRLAWQNTYADVRGWTAADVAAHPVLVNRLIDAGKADVLAHVAPPEERDDLPTFLRHTLANPPPATAPATRPVEQARW